MRLDPTSLRLVNLRECKPGTFIWYWHGANSTFEQGVCLAPQQERPQEVSLLRLTGTSPFVIEPFPAQMKVPVIAVASGPFRLNFSRSSLTQDHPASPGTLVIADDAAYVFSKGKGNDGFVSDFYVSLKNWSCTEHLQATRQFRASEWSLVQADEGGCCEDWPLIEFQRSS
ncbi:hypothetical protein [Hydrogenophaga taeniospiralis]|uniref:hypothetical protein n=1 Tax=Hydrogenophaga taeniospiralis TaxID=65656 RepID=UPI0012F957CB|nr:hypothetical protein [Hydrogenophaga taeniospiralis]